MKRIVAFLLALVAVSWPLGASAQTVQFISAQGTVSAQWHAGGPTGPLIQNAAGAIEARNAANSAYAVMRGATPVAANDLATKTYVDAITIPSLTGVATSTGCLSFGSGVYSWIACGGGSLGGDVTGTLGANTVTAISGSSPIAITPGVLQWGSGVTAPDLGQASTTGATGQNLKLTPQASTNANGTPGNLVIDLAAPTGSGAEADLEVTRGGSGLAWLGPVNTAPSYGALFLGTSTGTNYAMASNGSTLIINSTGGTNETQIYAGSLHQQDLYDDGTSGGIQLLYPGNDDFGGGRNVIGISPVLTSPTALTTSGVALSVPSHNVLELDGTTLQFPKYAGAVTIQEAGQTTDTATSLFTLSAQDAFVSATTNKTGGSIILRGGARATGGVEGTAKIQTADGNAQVLTQDAQVQLFTSGTLLLTLPTVNFAQSNSVSTITQVGETSDVATGTILFQGQAAWASAVTNPTGGEIEILGGAGTNAAHGGMVVAGAGDGSTVIVWQPDSIVGSSGTSAETIVFDGSGTVNSQVTKIDRQVKFGQTSSNGGLVTVTSKITLASGKSVTLHCHGLARTTTAAGSLNVGDTFEENADILVKNVAGTVTQVGTATVVSKIADSGFNATTSIGWNNAGTTVGCVMTTIANTGTTAVLDDSLWGTFEFN